jgi:23S rRNA pseudouridine2605 synthase/23S rRNA pseudouridine2604 synthase
MAEIRLQKYLSERGVCSRREAERLMAEGKVKINGKVVLTLGSKINPDTDKVSVDRKWVSGSPAKLYIKLHKPPGYVSSNPQKGEKEARSLIGVPDRIYNVGRLDKDSSGLLLFTNDGVFAYRLTHPSFEHEKEYLVEVDAPVTPKQMDKMSSGLPMLGKHTQACPIFKLGPRKFKIILREGMNRQIRRMCQKVGLRVLKLQRLRVDQFSLDDLSPGSWARIPLPQVQKFLNLKAA